MKSKLCKDPSCGKKASKNFQVLTKGADTGTIRAFRFCSVKHKKRFMTYLDTHNQKLIAAKAKKEKKPWDKKEV